MSSPVGVVITAAGSGTRFGGKKQLLLLGGRPILHYSLDVLARLEGVARVVVTLPADDLDEGRRLLFFGGLRLTSVDLGRGPRDEGRFSTEEANPAPHWCWSLL